MHLETHSIPCPVCGAKELISSHSVNKYFLGPCAKCGLWRLEPQPTPQALLAYYQQEYYSNRQCYKQVSLDAILNISKGKIPSFQETLEKLKNFAPGDRLLDVGCAFGQFLHFARQAGFQAEGVELDSALASRARDFGFKAAGGDFLTANLPTGAYDAVTFWYVLEHVTNPLDSLKKSWNLLSEGGILFVRVPNMLFGLPFLYASKLAGPRVLPSILSHIPAHLFFYTPSTLTALVKAAGFEPIGIEHGLPVFDSSESSRAKLANALRRANIRLADGVRWISGGKILPGAYLSMYARKVSTNSPR